MPRKMPLHIRRPGHRQDRHRAGGGSVTLVSRPTSGALCVGYTCVTPHLGRALRRLHLCHTLLWSHSTYTAPRAPGLELKLYD
eukprot:1196147-Prorocentrum_minimum.AAC.2